MEEPLFDSMKCAAGYINGDLRKTVFRRFLKLINSDIQNQNDTSAFPCAAVFVATAFRESSEEERKTLSKHITEELSVVPELIGALKTFWKEGQYWRSHLTQTAFRHNWSFGPSKAILCHKYSPQTK